MSSRRLDELDPQTVPIATDLLFIVRDPATTHDPFKMAVADFLHSSNGQLLFNDAGVLAGDSALTWDKTTDRLRVDGHGSYGAGNGPVVGSVLDVAEEYTGTSGSLFGTDSFISLNPSGNGTASAIGGAFLAEKVLANAFDAGSLFGLQASADNTNATSVLLGSVAAGSFQSNNSGTANDVYGLYVGAFNFGTSTDVWGIQIDDIGSGGGSQTNIAALKILDQTSPSEAIRTGNGGIFFGDDVELANGKAVHPDTTTAHTALLQAYDVDGAAYKTFATLTNGNTPDFTVAPPAGGTVTVQATTYKSSDGTSGAAGGTFTALTSITVKDGIVTAISGT